MQACTSPVPEPTSTDPEHLETSDLSNHHTQAEAALQPEDHFTANISSGQSRFSHEPRLEKLTGDDDIEHFLITFERTAAACRWPKLDWVFRLIPLLTGKTRSAYVHIDVDSLEYEKVKAFILQKNDIDPDPTGIDSAP